MITDTEYMMLHNYHRLKLALHLIEYSTFGYGGLRLDEQAEIKEILEKVLLRITEEMRSHRVDPDLEGIYKERAD